MKEKWMMLAAVAVLAGGLVGCQANNAAAGKETKTVGETMRETSSPAAVSGDAEDFSKRVGVSWMDETDRTTYSARELKEQAKQQFALAEKWPDYTGGLSKTQEEWEKEVRQTALESSVLYLAAVEAGVRIRAEVVTGDIEKMVSNMRDAADGSQILKYMAEINNMELDEYIEASYNELWESRAVSMVNDEYLDMRYQALAESSGKSYRTIKNAEYGSDEWRIREKWRKEVLDAAMEKYQDQIIFND